MKRPEKPIKIEKSNKPWYYGYLIGALRKIWRWSPVRREAYEKAKEGSKFKCASCHKGYEKDAVAVDHIEPVIPPASGFTTWDAYITNLFVTDVMRLQVLCKPCHKSKTNAENKERRKAA